MLELGCGTGDMWKGRETLILDCSPIILSDFSEGMVATAKEMVGDYDNIEYRVLDIQDIPYEDDSFDIIIANMMLYHVPNLDKGLSEVRRVLKKVVSFIVRRMGKMGLQSIFPKFYLNMRLKIILIRILHFKMGLRF